MRVVDTTGTQVRLGPGTPLPEAGLAADPSGNVWVAGHGKRKPDRHRADPTLDSTVSGGRGKGNNPTPPG